MTQVVGAIGRFVRYIADHNSRTFCWTARHFQREMTRGARSLHSRYELSSAELDYF